MNDLDLRNRAPINLTAVQIDQNTCQRIFSDVIFLININALESFAFCEFLDSLLYQVGATSLDDRFVSLDLLVLHNKCDIGVNSFVDKLGVVNNFVKKK